MDAHNDGRNDDVEEVMSALTEDVMDTEANRPVNRPESSLRIENSFNNIRLLALKNKLTKV